MGGPSDFVGRDILQAQCVLVPSCSYLASSACMHTVSSPPPVPNPQYIPSMCSAERAEPFCDDGMGLQSRADTFVSEFRWVRVRVHGARPLQPNPIELTPPPLRDVTPTAAGRAAAGDRVPWRGRPASVPFPSRSRARDSDRPPGRRATSRTCPPGRNHCMPPRPPPPSG